MLQTHAPWETRGQHTFHIIWKSGRKFTVEIKNLRNIRKYEMNYITVHLEQSEKIKGPTY